MKANVKYDARPKRVAATGVLTRQEFLIGSARAAAALLFVSLSNCGREDEGLRLEIFQRGFPRAFFFRLPEATARGGKLSYEEWEKRYLPLNGIMGKVLNEVYDNTGRNTQKFFLRYKQNNPEKIVLLHYNGTGRRPLDDAITDFFAGHWLYYAGSNLTQKVGSSLSETELHIRDTSVFSLKRSHDGVEDEIAIARVDSDGKPDWEQAEHVRLKAIEVGKNTIVVERGAYGTKPLSFPAGSYLAAHVTSGPFPDGLLWNYNFSSVGPRDAQGRTCGEVLVDYLVERLGSGGALSSLDGIEFDILGSVVRIARPLEEVDVDTDGEADGGIVDGVNVVNLGVLEFTKALRERLPDKIITADGHKPEESQRSFGDLNGIESEGYPNRFDFKLDHLSTAENIFRFWKEKSTAPSLSYANFKYADPRPEIGIRNTFEEPKLSQDQSYSKLRLALASAQFTDLAFTYTARWTPPQTYWRQEGVMVHIFDELWRGVDQKPNWLGEPRGPVVHLGAESSDLFGGQGRSWLQEFVGQFKGERVAFTRSVGPSMIVESTDPDIAAPERDMSFALPGIEVPRPNLFVVLRLTADPLKGYPARIARRVSVIARSGKDADRTAEEFTWAGEKLFEARFYFNDVGTGPVDLLFEVEGEQPVYFELLEAYAATDARYREFDNGAVFANPSTRPYTFNLAKLFPGTSFRKIQGSEHQDPAINDGQPLGDKLTLNPKDGLFVVRSGGNGRPSKG